MRERFNVNVFIYIIFLIYIIAFCSIGFMGAANTFWKHLYKMGMVFVLAAYSTFGICWLISKTKTIHENEVTDGKGK